MPTPERQRLFAAWAGPLAVGLERATGVAALVIVAQWAHETGYGTSPLYLEHRNLAGIRNARNKAFRGPVAPGTTFRHYDTLGQSLDDWVRVIRLPDYDAVRAAHGIDAQIAALGASPWDAGHYRGRSKANPPGTALHEHLTRVLLGAPYLAVPGLFDDVLTP